MHLRYREDDEDVEPETLRGKDIVRGDGSRIPNELPASDDERFAGDICETRLEPNMEKMDHVIACAEERDKESYPPVHEEAAAAAAPDGKSVEEERVDY